LQEPKMLEFGQTKAAPQPDLIVEATEATFMADVIEASKQVPVIVDFWAPWCGPCKTLGPALEAEVKAAKGKVKMVKIDVDKAPNISGQLQIQSIPTVYAFWQGKPVDAFQGALPASELKTFVAKIAAMGGDEEGLGEALEAAETMLAEGAAEDAAQTFAAILGEEPTNAIAYGGLVRAHIALGDLDQAEAGLNGAPVEISKSPELDAAHAQLELAKQAAGAGPVGELLAAVEADPANLQARFDLALALHANGDVQGAVDQLMDVFGRDRDWNEGAAKEQLFTIFGALPAKDPIALNGRRKLSSMIFA